MPRATRSFVIMKIPSDRLAGSGDGLHDRHHHRHVPGSSFGQRGPNREVLQVGVPWITPIMYTMSSSGYPNARESRPPPRGRPAAAVLDLPAQSVNVTSLVSETPAVRPGALWFCQ